MREVIEPCRVGVKNGISTSVQKQLRQPGKRSAIPVQYLPRYLGRTCLAVVLWPGPNMTKQSMHSINRTSARTKQPRQRLL